LMLMPRASRLVVVEMVRSRMCSNSLQSENCPLFAKMMAFHAK
jgi:hypothetical protein